MRDGRKIEPYTFIPIYPSQPSPYTFIPIYPSQPSPYTFISIYPSQPSPYTFISIYPSQPSPYTFIPIYPSQPPYPSPTAVNNFGIICPGVQRSLTFEGTLVVVRGTVLLIWVECNIL